MKNKIDTGFELIYWNLSYRRKFIRTLWTTPFCVIGILLIISLKLNMLIKIIIPIILTLIYIWQLTYTYKKWKKEEQS